MKKQGLVTKIFRWACVPPDSSPVCDSWYLCDWMHHTWVRVANNWQFYVVSNEQQSWRFFTNLPVIRHLFVSPFRYLRNFRARKKFPGNWRYFWMPRMIVFCLGWGAAFLCGFLVLVPR